jgi:hypothetical protein
MRVVSKKKRNSALEKEGKNGKRSKMKPPDLRHGMHGVLTNGGLVGEEKPDPFTVDDGGEVIATPDSNLPSGQTTRM